MPTKQEIRSQVKERWINVNRADREKHERSLCQNLAKTLRDVCQKNKISTLGVYSPFPDEPNWSEALEDFHFIKAYPDCFDMDDMVFRSPRDRELIMREMFQTTIMSPSKELPEVTPDGLLVPGLAFDVGLQRLGRGRGYYDRYLKNFIGPTFGLCFEFQLFNQIPTEEHDQPVDFVITEKQVLSRSSSQTTEITP